jgi:protein disulfide-isomerase
VPSRTSILETINKVTASPPKLKPKLTIGFFEKILFDVKTNFKEHPYLSGGCVLGIAFGCLSWFRGRVRRTRGGHFRLDDGAGGGGNNRAPLLGGSSGANGNKVD